jgi:hypothetical protein
MNEKIKEEQGMLDKFPSNAFYAVSFWDFAPPTFHGDFSLKTIRAARKNGYIKDVRHTERLLMIECPECRISLDV